MVKRIAFMAYSWTPGEPKLDPYLSEIVKTFSIHGYDVDVYFGNEFNCNYTNKKFKKYISFPKLCSYIKSREYDLVISINNSMISDKTIAALGDNVVSIIVDEINHLFDHDEQGPMETFKRKNIKFVTSSKDMYKKISAQLSSPEISVFFLPTATNIKQYHKEKDPHTHYRHNISCIMSFLSCDLHHEILKKVSDNYTSPYPHYEKFIKAVNEGDNIYSLDNDTIQFISDLAATIGADIKDVEMSAQNHYSNNKRVDAVKALSDLGLTLYGNIEWIRYNPELSKIFRDGREWIKSHKDIADIYNKSRISINITQHHSTSLRRSPSL